jgi:hypothetical protein
MSLQDQAPLEKENIVMSKSLVYKMKTSAVPKYKKHRIVPNSGSLETVVAKTGTTETIFELPAGKAYNLAETTLYGTFNIPRPAVNRYNWIPVDHFPKIREFQIYTRGGTYTCNIANLAKYLKLNQKRSMSNKNFLNRSAVEYFYPSNEPVSILRVEDFKTAAGDDFKDVAIKTYTSANVRADGTPSKINFYEQKYVMRGEKSADAVAGPPAVPEKGALIGNFQIRLGDLPDLVPDKDIYLNEVLVVRITWDGIDNYAWTSDSALNPASNPALTADGTQMKLTNLGVYLAVETDEDIVQDLRSKVNSSGLQILIPYVWYFKYTLSNDQQNIGIRLNSAHGMSLTKIITAPFNNTETKNTSQDHSNINGSKVRSYYTMVDNTRTTEFEITCTDEDAKDFMIQKDILKGTPLADKDVYRYNWFIMDDFSRDQEVNNDPNTINGLPLTSQERKWDMTASTVFGTYNWYTFAITQRKLIIGPQMVEVR